MMRICPVVVELQHPQESGCLKRMATQDRLTGQCSYCCIFMGQDSSIELEMKQISPLVVELQYLQSQARETDGDYLIVPLNFPRKGRRQKYAHVDYMCYTYQQWKRYLLHTDKNMKLWMNKFLQIFWATNWSFKWWCFNCLNQMHFPSVTLICIKSSACQTKKMLSTNNWPSLRTKKFEHT